MSVETELQINALLQCKTKKGKPRRDEVFLNARHSCLLEVARVAKDQQLSLFSYLKCRKRLLDYLNVNIATYKSIITLKSNNFYWDITVWLIRLSFFILYTVHSVHCFLHTCASQKVIIRQ